MKKLENISTATAAIVGREGANANASSGGSANGRAVAAANSAAASSGAPSSNVSPLAYLEDYLDTIESLPVELSRNYSLMRELDATVQTLERTIEQQTTGFPQSIVAASPEERVNRILHLTTIFKEYLKHGEDKVALAIQTYDMVDRHIRRLDDDLGKYEEEQMTGPKMSQTVTANARGEEPRAPVAAMPAPPKLPEKRLPSATTVETPNSKKRKTGKDKATERASPPPPTAVVAGTPRKEKSKVASTAAVTTSSKSSGSQKKDKSKKGADPTPKASSLKPGLDDLPIDPNEPRYCICNQVSYGEMIGCDNTDCEIEWFHYQCVGLTGPVKGKWYCPSCTDKRKRKD
ncbi:hypothetical protein DFJ73DRAFT_855170 [Zopfochytrium polystomum]|nr:hypothetical protein DFJ73DRAFT_855170 [Zopfochytrium polystomum]